MLVDSRVNGFVCGYVVMVCDEMRINWVRLR